MENLTTEQIILIKMLSDLIHNSDMNNLDKLKAQMLLQKITQTDEPKN